MNDTPEKKLARALRAAAEEYCGATGRTFEAHFNFIETTSIHDERPTYRAGNVTVMQTQETRA